MKVCEKAQFPLLTANEDDEGEPNRPKSIHNAENKPLAPNVARMNDNVCGGHD